MSSYLKHLIVLMPIAAGALWGSAGVFVRDLNAFGMDNYTVLGTRMIVAVVLMFALMFAYDRSMLKIRLKDFWLFAGAGIPGMLFLNLCYNEAIGMLALSLSAILLSMAPFFAILMAAVLFNEKITRKKAGCMITAFAGCALASGIFDGAGVLHWSMSGIVMGIMAAFFYALYGIFSKMATNRGYHTFSILFYSILLIAVVMIPFTDWRLFGTFLAASPVENSVFAVAHSLCTSILPYMLFSFALVHMETGKAAILAGGAEPVSAVIFGAAFFAEIPTILTFSGIVLAVFALSYLCYEPKTENEVKAAVNES